MSDPTGAVRAAWRLAAMLKTVKDLLGSLTEVAQGAARRLAPGEADAAAQDAAPAAGADAQDAAAPPLPADQITAMLHKAREAYDRATRWVVGAFAAVGVLVFGSLPFADVGGQELVVPWSPGAGGAELTLHRPTQLLAGLLLAGAGIVLVVWATTRTLEPEDATLGELAQTLDEVRPPHRFWSGPVPKANWALRRVLSGDEAAAHLGPGVAPYPPARDGRGAGRRGTRGGHGPGGPDGAVVGVRGTIRQLERSEAALFAQDQGHAAAVAAAEALAADRAAVAAVLAGLRGELAGLRTATPPDPDSTARVAALREQVQAYEEHDLALLRAWRPADLAAARVRAQEQVRLRTFREHRELLLAESLMAQVRGTFRRARGLVLVGAVCTLLGGVLYGTALPVEDGDGDAGDDAPAAGAAAAAFDAGLPVAVSVVADTGTWRAVEPPACRSAASDGLTALLLEEEPVPSVNGPFTVLVTEPPQCRGRLTVARDEGRYAPLAAAEPPGSARR